MNEIQLDTKAEAALVAELNDLLQLDYDAVAAYTLALNALDDPAYQDAVRRFKGDHERHIDDLTALIHSYGGIPMPMPHASGVFKLAVQGAGALGDDAAVITAFKANEVQSRDKYRKAAARQHPADVQGVLIRASRDEQRHFDWAMRTLSELGVETGAVAETLEQMHARSADAMEAVERGAMQVAEYTRRAVRDAGPSRLALAGLVLVGAAAAITVMTRRRW
jgi:bacterioferritin (cytochrome b1)